MTRHVLIAHRPCLGKLAGRVFDAEQQVIHRRAAVLPRQVHVEDRVDLIAERKFKGRPAEQHDDGLFAAFRKRVDQFQMLLRHPHVLAVAALGFVFIRQSRKDQHRVAFRKRDALHAVRVEGVLRRCDLRRADHGASRALIAHVLEELARNVQLFRALERQHAVVFQKNRAVRRDLARKRVMRIPVHGRGIGGLCVPVDPVQDIAARLVKVLRRQRTVLNAVEDPSAADCRIARHFKIETGF